MLGRKLKQWADQYGSASAGKMLCEGLKTGRISPGQFSLRGLAEACHGSNWAKRITESVDPTNASAFTDITGQFLFQTIRDNYDNAEFVGDSLMTVETISNGNLGPQREPWLGSVPTGDIAEIQDGDKYPFTRFRQQFVDYPAPSEFGAICAITMRMVFSDLTQQARDRAADVGRAVRIRRERRQLRVIAGLDNNHSWNGVAYNTYGVAADNLPWVNRLVSTPLVDWTSINAVEQLAVNMLDPVSGEPISIKPTALLVVPALYYTAKRIFSATEVRSGDITTGAGNQTASANPLTTDYPLMKSTFLRREYVRAAVADAAADARWFLGDFKRAFKYREVHGLQILQAPPGNVYEFEQNVALAVRASEYGVACVADPRYVFECRGA